MKQELRWPIEDIVAVGDIARELKVSPGAIVNWRNRYSTFPAPLKVLHAGALYSMNQVLAWRERQQRGEVVRDL